MSKKNYTHIGIVLDRSGSMASMKKDVIGGFNTFIEEQNKVEGEATITFAQFDTQYDLLQDFTKLSNVPVLTDHVFQPRGSTALLDAMGKSLTDVRSKVKTMDEEERPEKVIFVFITDGEENASHEYNKDRVFKMIEDLRDEEEINWEFVFIGANQDAIQAGNGLGVRQGRSINYDASGAGTQVMFASLTSGMNNYRSKGLHEVSSADYSFFDSTADKKDDFLKNPKGPLQNMYVDSTRKTRSSKKNKDTK